MANQVTLTFGGDADQLAKAAKQADEATAGVAKGVSGSADEMKKASKTSDDLLGHFGQLGAAVTGASTAFDDVGSAVSALSDLQKAGAERASAHARALSDVDQAGLDAKQALRDVSQAQLDLNQSFVDAKQATANATQAQIDIKQAALDAETAQNDYNDAVKEHGKNSAEAKQATIDLAQATQDLSQANIDAEQATADAGQAQEDTKQSSQDMTQAQKDAKDAQLDLNDAQREANPPELAKFSQQLELVTPLLAGMTSVTGLVTAAQWAWNAAQAASPTTWIIIAIVALIAVIVLIATKTTWFQDIWRVAWGGIKTAAVAVWDWLNDLPGKIGDTFKSVSGAISAPFRAAFNLVSDAWNNTIGKLSWTVPGWIPFIGGNTIAAPHLPRFHAGGVVPGAPGSEMMAILQAGETVTPAGQGGGMVLELRSSGNDVDDMLVEILSRAVGRRGGNVQLVVGR